MSLRFIYGNAISVKSSRAYAFVIEESERHPEWMYQVIVPEQATLLMQQQMLRLHPRKSLRNIDVVSFNRLAYRVMEEIHEPSPHILDDTGKSMILRKIAAHIADSLEVFTGNLSRRGFMEQLKSILSEFLQYGVMPDQLGQIAKQLEEQPLLQRKLRDLQKLYAAFRETMGSGQIAAEELLLLLCGWMEKSEQVRNSIFVLDGFTGFTPVQYQILELLLRYAREVHVVLTADPKENLWKISGEYERFYMSKTMACRLGKMADQLGIRVDPPLIVTESRPTADALRALEAGLFRYPLIPYEDDQDAVRICRARTPRKEVQYVLGQILTLVRKEHYRYAQIAVICGDMGTYVPLIRQVFGNVEIPLFVDEKKDLLHNPLVELIRGVLEMIEEDFSYESVFHCVRNALYPERRSRIDALENYVKALGVRGSSRWKKEWTRDYKGRPAEPDLAELNEVRKRIGERIFPLREAFSEKRSVKQVTVCLYEFLDQIGAEQTLASMADSFRQQGEMMLEKEYVQCFEKVMSMLDQMVDVMGDEVVSLSDYRDILDSGFENLQVGLIPPAIDRLVIGDMERTRLEGIRALFLLGVNEGIFPSGQEKGGLLSDLDRERLKALDFELAPTGREESFTQKYYLYLMMTKPSRYLFLSYASLSGEGKSLRPSYLIGTLKKLFPRQKESVPGELAAKEGGQSMVMTKDNSLPLLLDAIRQYDKDPSVDWWRDLYTWYYTHEPYREQLFCALEGMFASYEREYLPRPLAAQLFGLHPQNSVTRLERFAGCAYAHFLAYGLKLREREEYELEAMDYGNIFHSSIELFFRLLEERGIAWRLMTDEQRTALVRESVGQVTMEYGNTILQSSARNQYLAKRLEKMTDRTIWALTKQMRAGSFESKGSEVFFSTLYHTPSLRLDVGAGMHMDFQGRIDRLDLFREENRVYVKIIDYKSGGTSFDLTKLYYGLQLQLILYLAAAMEMEQRQNPKTEVVPAGIYYYQMKNPLVEASDLEGILLDDPKEQSHLEESAREAAEAAMLEELRMDGLSNEDPRILQLIDHTPGKKSFVVKNLVRGEDGSAGGRSQVASSRQIKQLCRYGKDKAQDLGTEMMEGSIPVNPYEYRGKTACDFCEYRGVCGFDIGIEGFSYRRLHPMDPEEMWNDLRERETPDEREDESQP